MSPYVAISQTLKDKYEKVWKIWGKKTDADTDAYVISLIEERKKNNDGSVWVFFSFSAGVEKKSGEKEANGWTNWRTNWRWNAIFPVSQMALSFFCRRQRL